MHLPGDEAAAAAGDAGQGGRKRADDFGMELGAGEPPDLAQRFVCRPRAAIRAFAGDAS